MVGKCILCKDSSRDSIHYLQLQVMTVITIGVKINFRVAIYNWIAKWFKDADKRIKDGKPLPRMYYGKFISIVLKKKRNQHIREKDGEPLNINKKITNKLFENWKRNHVEINKSKQSKNSEKTVTEVQKPFKVLKKRKFNEDEGDKESLGSTTPKTLANLALIT